MSDKKRKLLKQTSLVDFMCGSSQSKRQKKTNTEMNEEEHVKVRNAAEIRFDSNSPHVMPAIVNDESGVKSKSIASKTTGASSMGQEDSNNTLQNEKKTKSDIIPKKKPNKISENVNFLGSALSSLNSAPNCLVNTDTIKPDKTHTVLFECPFKYYVTKCPPVPYPKLYKDNWDSNHVRMPCSNSNEYPVEGAKGMELKRRWSLIEAAFKDVIIPGPFELEESILSYNQRYKTRWDFLTFRKFFIDFLSKEEREKFFNTLLPKIIKLALQLPLLCTMPIPLLQKWTNHSISMSQQQIACLLANAFLCTFPRRNSRLKTSEFVNYPDINFNGLYQGGSKKVKFQKLKCIIHYFERITNKLPVGVVTFTRQFIENTPRWEDVRDHLPDRIHVNSNGTIEDDGFGMLQVDFANKFIGGGVLGHGCVQEEIRFLICPEMLISKLFTEVLEKKECLIMKGCERFSNYEGYANSFVWAGNYDDPTIRDDNGRLYCDVVGIDALVIHSFNEQFKSSMVERELNKAFVGFEILNGKNRPASSRPSVCTGNWGCGAFRGDNQLKALIQLMAAAVAKRNVSYFTFGDAKLTEDIFKTYDYLKANETEIGVLMLTIEEYYKTVCQPLSRRKKIPLFDYIYEKFESINHSESEDSFEEDNDIIVHDVHDSSRENSLDSEVEEEFNTPVNGNIVISNSKDEIDKEKPHESSNID